MKRKTMALAGIVTIAAIAFLLVAPVVPFSMEFNMNIGLPVQIPMSLNCSNPRNLTGMGFFTSPGVNYKGYESVVYYMSGVGVVLFTECTYQ